MASKYGRNAFTVQEATNGATYYTYKSQDLTLNGTTAQETTDWSSSGQSAKEVVLFGKGGEIDDDAVTINFKVNGSYGDNIVVNFDNLPLTVKGMLIDQVKITGAGGADDVITVLSFH